MTDKYMTGEMRVRALEKESLTKKDLPHCQCTDAEIAKSFIEDVEAVKDQLPSTKNDLGVREFEGIEVTYPPEDICTYPEYKGKPYFGIQYRENGESIVGYGTYSPQVLSRYLKDYFMPTTKDDLGVDCISKQAVLNKILKFSVTDGRSVSVTGLWTEVNELPSATPQEPRWISVNEKLPNDRDWYLGIFKEPDTGWINPLPFVCDFVGSETKATTKEYWILRGFTDRDEHIDYYFNLECVAWMPLPKPYKAAGEEA